MCREAHSARGLLVGMRPHPALLLLSWLVLVVALQSQPLPILVAAVAVTLPLAQRLARRQIETLLQRSRFLLFSLFLLFAFATPGLMAPPPFDRLGLTFDGLQLASEHVARLLVVLATLALVHRHLGTQGLLGGLYWLLAPLGHGHDLRRPLVVRLLLVLEAVEKENLTWRQWLTPPRTWPATLTLITSVPKGFERVLIYFLLGVLSMLLMVQP